jgi:outer membrane protein, heavy metal efflux system
VYRLEELEQIALAHNPTLAQAAADINSAKGRRQQSGLYPNPRAGYEGEEIPGGAYGGCEQGFFIAQPFITGGVFKALLKVECSFTSSIATRGMWRRQEPM